MILCLYHRGDFDGHCAGAIVQRMIWPQAQMIGLDYEDDFAVKIPWSEINQGTKVYMMDFSLPMEDMKRLQELTGGYNFFVWIDHHETAIDKAREAGFECDGLRMVGKAACELTWMFFFPDTPMPWAVHLLGRYDVFDTAAMDTDPNILQFQYGLRALITDPVNSESHELWDSLLQGPIMGNEQAWDATNRPIIQAAIIGGRWILDYEKVQNAKLMAQYGFSSELEGLPALVVNNGPGGSMKFEGHAASAIPFLISFARVPNNRWRVNLYTFREDVDCGQVARRHGGGGHRKAAGFVCDELPFKI